MKNITVSVDEETYRQARIRAAELDTSVSALVREYLQSLSDASPEFQKLETASERRMRKLLNVIEDIGRNNPNFKMSDNVPREELYDRHASR